MKTLSKWIRMAAALMLGALMFACTGNKQPSTEFSAYIKAYTGGVVPGNATIRIEFLSSLGANQNAEGLLSFTPSIKGQARWASNNLLEFIPEEGELKPGKAYNACLRLDKLTKVSSELKKFEFSFAVAPKQLDLTAENIRITAADPDMAAVSGTLRFSSDIPSDKVSEVIKWEYPASAGELKVNPSTEANAYSFEISGLKRTDTGNTLKITADAKHFGYSKTDKEEVAIPEKGSFGIIAAKLNEDAEPSVDIIFSQPLDPNQSPDGLFTLTNVGRYFYQKDANRMRIFFESLGSGDLSVIVNKAVKSIDGEVLGENMEFSSKRDEAVPSVKIKLDGNIMPDPSNLVLPFTAQNLNAVDIRIIKVYESNVLGFMQENWSFNGDSEIRRSGRLVYKNTIRLDGDPSIDLHQANLFGIDLSGIMKEEQGAIYKVRLTFRQEYSLYGKGGITTDGGSSSMITLNADRGLTPEDEAIWDEAYSYYYESFTDWMEYDWEERDDPTKPSFYMDGSRFPSVSLVCSNIGLIVKSAGNGRVWVATNDIMSTDPIKGAEVNVYNFQLQKIGSGKTDGSGLAEIEVSGKPWAVTARSGKTISYLKVEDGLENSLSRFETGGKTVSKGLKGYVYGERGVWRPGDTLHVTLVVEDIENRLPENHPVAMEVYTPQGQFYDKQVKTDGVDGFYTFEIATSPDDPTGTWNAYFKVGGASFYKALHVETVKPNRLKIKLTTPDEVMYSGKSYTFAINSNWLTGPAAAGLKANVEMTLSKSWTSFKGWEKYDFNNPSVNYYPLTYTIVEKELDANGTAVAKVNMPAVGSAPGMLKASIVTRVFEQGGDASINTSEARFSPYQSYVGICTPESASGWLETDKDYSVEIASVSQDGKALSGQELEYKIYKMNWSWWWDNDADSYGSYVNSSYAKPLESGKVKSENGRAEVKFRVNYPEWGRYLVYVKDRKSGHAVAATMLVDWPSWQGRSDKSDPSNASMLAFSTDKKSYKVGETVNVYIPAAAKGRALISFENGSSVIGQKWVSTGSEETVYKFKVTPQMAPNFYIHITLLQPQSKRENDAPIRLYGVQSINVENEGTHLKPVINAPEVIRPQEQFTLKVKEENGKPMTYTIAIVDEGLLDLTNFKTPDPWKEMYAKQALGVSTWDLYDNVIGAFASKLAPVFSVGGDEDVNGSKSRENRFNPVVKFIGPFTLKSGSASHKITLPMYVGSVRIMVVAGKNGAYGCAEKAVPVRNPLMVVPTLPRVMGCTEKVTLPVNVFALEDDIKDVEVGVKVEGPLKLVDGASQNIRFHGTGDELVRFSLAAGSDEGKAKVTVTASGNGKTAKEVVYIDVRNPNPAITVVEKKAIAKGKSAEFSWTGANEASLELAGFPSIDVNGTFSYVRNYSYYCTEQLSSRGLSLIYTMDLLNDENAAKAKEMIPEILKQLYSRQLADGGFAYWPGQSAANEWASSMAGQFLNEASNKGFKVEGGVLKAWKNFQKKCTVNYRKSQSKNLDDLQQAYRLYTLALAGAADESAMNRLKSAEDLSVQAKWRLAAAYAIRGKKAIAKEMVQDLETSVEEYSDNLTFGSSSRDKAMVLEALVLIDDLTAATAIAQDVADEVTGSYSTQTVAFGSVAIGRLAAKMDTGALQAEVNGNKVKTANALYSEVLNPGSGKVSIKNTSDGVIYAGLTTSAQAGCGTVVPANESGLSVSVSFTDTKGAVLNPSSIRQGTDFYEKIVVSNLSGAAAKDYTNLALTQMIPSGWEIFNERLFGGSSKTEAEHSYKDIRDDRVDWFFDLPAGSKKTFWIRLQASYEGQFILPAASCSAMYENGIAGNSASGQAVVTR